MLESTESKEVKELRIQSIPFKSGLRATVMFRNWSDGNPGGNIGMRKCRRRLKEKFSSSYGRKIFRDQLMPGHRYKGWISYSAQPKWTELQRLYAFHGVKNVYSGKLTQFFFLFFFLFLIHLFPVNLRQRTVRSTWGGINQTDSCLNQDVYSRWNCLIDVYVMVNCLYGRHRAVAPGRLRSTISHARKWIDEGVGEQGNNHRSRNPFICLWRVSFDWIPRLFLS